MSTTVFVECVSCGAELQLGIDDPRYQRVATDDRSAARKAHRRGWTVAGFYGAKRTRCLRCRKERRTDTIAADDGRIGRKAGGQTTGRARL